MAEALALPTGTVTFLFTDIAGSTQRWEHDRTAMSAALARSRLTRTLTPEECRQYLHVEACPAGP